MKADGEEESDDDDEERETEELRLAREELERQVKFTLIFGVEKGFL